MYPAIVTKYFGPTDHKGTRVRAKADAGSIWWSWDHALNAEDNHTGAAAALATKLNWGGEWVGGAMAGGGYCFCLRGPSYARQTAFIVALSPP